MEIKKPSPYFQSLQGQEQEQTPVIGIEEEKNELPLIPVLAVESQHDEQIRTPHRIEVAEEIMETPSRFSRQRFEENERTDGQKIRQEMDQMGIKITQLENEVNNERLRSKFLEEENSKLKHEIRQKDRQIQENNQFEISLNDIKKIEEQMQQKQQQVDHLTRQTQQLINEKSQLMQKFDQVVTEQTKFKHLQERQFKILEQDRERLSQQLIQHVDIIVNDEPNLREEKSQSSTPKRAGLSQSCTPPRSAQFDQFYQEGENNMQ